LKKIFKNIRDFILAAALGAGAMFTYLTTRDLLGIVPPGWLTAILVVIAALIISVAVHEFGHFIAGKAVGFKFFMLTVGPIKFQRRGEHIRLEINKHLNTGGGLTIMLPETERYEDSDMFWFILGGPLGNFVLTLAALATVLTLVMINSEFAGNLTSYILYTTAFVSFLIGAMALIPAKSDAFESDGTQLQDLRQGGDKAAIKQKLMALTVTIWNGTRPRDINKKELDILLEMTGTGTDSTALTARLIAALYHLDRSQFKEAEAEIDTIIESLEKEGNVILEGTVYSEKAFIAAVYRRDSETAQTYLEKAKKGYTEGPTVARAEAALLVLNGKMEEAQKLAEEGIADADASADKGSAIFDKEILEELRQGILPDSEQ